MTGESSLFDIPPPQVGRYRVQQQIGVGAAGPVFRAEDPDTQWPVAIEVLHTHLSPEVNQQVAEDLAALINRLPAHPTIVPVRAAGLDNQEPYLVCDLIAGEGLDDALNRYGPGAIADVLPRIRVLAEALDEAAARDLCHGTLHPGSVIISESSTSLTGVGIAAILASRGVSVPVRRPYTAPEIAKGAEPTPVSDQFALAALAFEWLFGEVIAGPASAPLEVPELPGVKSRELAKAFTTALAPEPSSRFKNCLALVDRLSAAAPETVAAPETDRFLDVPDASGADRTMAWDDNDSAEDETASELTLEPSFSSGSMFVAEPAPQRTFGLGALAVTLFLGMGVGLAAGYFATTRLLPTAIIQPSTPTVSTPTPPVVNPAVPATRPEPKAAPPPEAKSGTDVPVSADPKAPAMPSADSKTAAAKKATPAATPAVLGRLQIRSTPSGASVQVDGVVRGVTPLTLSDVALGTRAVSVSSSGYVGEERSVTLSASQPSQNVDVKLARARTAAATRQTPGAPAGQSPVSGTGSLMIDSRPPGAAVTVNGVPRGTTPVSIDRLPPGDYTVTMRLENFRPVSMVVHVAAGERARAAASLTQLNGQEHE